MATDDPTLYARFASPAFADPEADVGLDPPAGHTGPVPTGLALVTWLQEALAAAGQELLNQWVIPGGHAFDVGYLGKRFDVAVAREGDPEEAWWRLSVEPRRGLLPWRRPSVTGFEAVTAALHRALAGDPRLEGLRWYTAAEWERPEPGEGHAEPPAG